VRRDEKETKVAALREEFERAQVAIVADFRGLKVEEETRLRRDCRKAGVSYRVVKNSLARLAVDGTEFEAIASLFSGPCALALSDEDPGAPARTLAKFKKETKKLELRGGQIRGRAEPLTSNDVEELARMPGKDELRAQLLSVMVAVPTGFVRALSEVPAKFVRVVEAYRKEKEQAA